MKKVRAYWWRGNPSHPVKNFGDALSPYLLKRFADIRTAWSPVSHSNVVSIGSLLEHVPPLWDGHILGTGKLYEDSRLHLHTNTAKIWALRGPLTARCVPGDYALGDPGLLADELVTVDHRDVGLGIVAHWTDSTLAKRPEFYSRDFETMVIDVAGDPLDVVRSIGRCQKIVTSSLHGLVVADAFGIPRRYEMIPNASRYEGGLFKIRDYSASIQAPFEPGKLIEASRFYVEDRKFEIWDAYRAMGAAL